MPIPDLFILAAGNPGIVKILEPIQRSGPRFASVSVLDDDKSMWGSDFLGYPIVGGISVLEGRDPVRTVILNNVARPCSGWLKNIRNGRNPGCWK